MRRDLEKLPVNAGITTFIRGISSALTHGQLMTELTWESPSLYVHPDILLRLEDLGSVLGPDSQGIAADRPVLVDPDTGEIVAVGLGTFYLIRASRMSETSTTPHSRVQKMSSGKVISLDGALSPEWRFGNWEDEEYETLNSGSQRK